MKANKPVQVAVINRGTYKHPNLEYHLVGESKVCDDRSWSVPVEFIAPAISFVNSERSCYVCRRSLAREIERPYDDVFVFDDLDAEMDSPFGRPAAQILEDEGLVPRAAKQFSRQYPDVVAGLARAPMNDVLEVVQKQGWSQSVYVFCKHCGERHSRIGDWPKVQGLILQCHECDERSEYDFDDYVPDYETAKAHLESVSDPSDYRANLVDVVDHAVDVSSAVVDAEFGEPMQVHVHRTEEHLIAHAVVDDEIPCGMGRIPRPIEVYELTRLKYCKNCERTVELVA